MRALGIPTKEGSSNASSLGHTLGVGVLWGKFGGFAMLPHTSMAPSPPYHRGDCTPGPYKEYIHKITTYNLIDMRPQILPHTCCSFLCIILQAAQNAAGC